MVASPRVSGTVVALAFTSALLSAVATVLIRAALQRYGPYTGVWLNVLVGTVVFWLVLAVSGGAGRAPATSIAVFVLAGLLRTLGGRVFRFMSIATVGAAIRAALVH